MRRAIGHRSNALLLVALILGTTRAAVAQQPLPDLSSASVDGRAFFAYLIDGNHEDLMINGDVPRTFYVAGVYQRGIELCNELENTDISPSQRDIFRDPKESVRISIPLTGRDLGLLAFAQRLLLRAETFHGLGHRDIGQHISAFGCDAQTTRTVIHTAEAITIKRIEDAKDYQVQVYEDRLVTAAGQRKEREMQAKHDRELREGQEALRVAYGQERPDCQQKFPRIHTPYDPNKQFGIDNMLGGSSRPDPRGAECGSDARQRFDRGMHELETGLEYSYAHRQLVSMANFWARQTARANVCENVQIANLRAGIEALAEQYYAGRASSFLEIYDAEYDTAYQYGLDYFKGCSEALREHYQHIDNDSMQAEIMRWRELFHGKPNLEPHKPVTELVTQ